MATSLKDFLKSASLGQKELLFELNRLSDEEDWLRERHNRKMNSFLKQIKEAENRTLMYAQMTKDWLYKIAAETTARERKQIYETRIKIKELMIKAVNEYNLGGLDFIQRNYKAYAGEEPK